MDTSSEFRLESTNGGWAFVGSRPRETATVVKMAVDAGLILMGKANLSVRFGSSSRDPELTPLAIRELEVSKVRKRGTLLINLCRGSVMSGGWSARGGQTQSAYVRGGVINDGIYGHSVKPLHSSRLFQSQCSRPYRTHPAHQQDQP